MSKDVPDNPVDSVGVHERKAESRLCHQDSRVRKLACRDIERGDYRTKAMKGARPLRRAAAQFEHIAASRISKGLATPIQGFARRPTLRHPMRPTVRRALSDSPPIADPTVPDFDW